MKSATHKIKFAIIGCASVSAGRYFPSLGGLTKGQLVAVCDSVAERARSRAEEFGVPYYTELGDMLARAGFDLLVNLTNIQNHYETSLKALRAGKHVYVQKPMTTSVEEADRLIDEAAERGLKLVAEQSAGLNPYYITIRKLIEEGAIGKIVWARSLCTHCGPASFDTWPTDPSWFYKKGAGPLFDVEVERLHLLTFLLGPAKRVTALSGIREPEVVVRGGPCKGKIIKVVEVIAYPEESHCFGIWGDPRPAAGKLFADVASFFKRHLRTQPIPIDRSLVSEPLIPAR